MVVYLIVSVENLRGAVPQWTKFYYGASRSCSTG